MRALVSRLAIALAIVAAPASAVAQSAPAWLTYGYTPTAGQWQAAFASKQDVLTFTPLNRAGGTMTGKLQTAPATINGAGFSLLPGIAPTAPASGDLWATNQGFFGYINGSIVSLGASASTGAVRYDQSQSLTSGQQAQARTNSGSAASGTNTDITSLAGPALGAATATTPSAGDNSTRVATTAALTTALTGAGVNLSDDCARLSLVSSTSLQVAPIGCSTIVIGGVPRPLTTATVSNSATTFGTLYYGYASWSGSAVTLTLSTTGHVTGSDGREYQSNSGSANTAFRYVGMAYTAGSSGTGTFADGPTQRFVATWGKRVPRPLLGTANSGTSGSTTPVEANGSSRVQFVAHADELVDLETGGVMSNSSANQGEWVYPGLDGTALGPGNYYQDNVANMPGPAASRATTLASEGLHYGTVMFKAGGGSANVTAAVVGVIR